MSILITRQRFVGKDLLAQLEGKNVVVCRVEEVFGEKVEEGKVAELCRRIVREMDVKEEEPNEVVNLMYVGDVMEELRRVVCEGRKHDEGKCVVPRFYTKVWGEVVNLVWSFKKRMEAGEKVVLKDDFERKLYATYISYEEKGAEEK